jgi:transposase
MAAKRRAYSAEFKRQAVQSVLSGKKPRHQIARELGIRADLLYQWQKALAPQTARQSEPLNASAQERRIHELEREVATLREEREILKKATAFFAKEGR